ncbi:MAG: MFS transporter [Pseudomonadota bacterium]|nr:MFS transporter [Pseudomonadota bacterium]
MPASLLMVRFGRRPIFIVGVLIAAFAAFLQAVAIMIDNFVLFCVSSMVLGSTHGYASFCRYAATDCTTEQARPKAISYILTVGLMAAFFGPEIARNMVRWAPDYLYAGYIFRHLQCSLFHCWH